MEYHVIIMPLSPWESCIPKTFSELKLSMQVACRLFSFKPRDMPKSKGTGSSLLLSLPRLPFLKHEVMYIRDITSIVKEKAKDIVDKIDINCAYASDFAIEIVSSSPKILCDYQEDLDYCRLSARLIHDLFELGLPFYSSIEGMDLASMWVPSVVACRVVLCDNISEVIQYSEALKLKKITDALYIGDDKTTIRYNVFNFLPRGLWSKIFISGPIVTLKTELLEYPTNDELGYLIALIHSLGRFYIISESIRGFCAAVELTSWSIDDLCFEYRKKLRWLRRNFSQLDKDFHEIKKEIKEIVFPFIRLTSSPQVQKWMALEYGVEPIPNWTPFSELLRSAKKYEIPSDDLKKSVLEDLKMLTDKLSEFLDQFSASINTQLQLQSSKVGYNQFTLAIAGIILAFLTGVIAFFA